MEINIGPKISPIKPKTFNPKIIPNTEFSGWIFSILFKNYKIIARVLDGEEIEIVENMSPEAKKDRRQVTNINFFFTLTKKKDIITETEVVRNQVNKEELTEEEFYNLEPPIPSEEEIEEYNAMQ